MRRRTFLRGAGGVAVALPLLESLHWRRFTPTASAAGPATKRLLVYFTCNGANLETFFPATDYGPLSAASFPDTCALAPLRDHASRLLIPRGIYMAPRGFNWDDFAQQGDDHAKGMGHKLTAQPLLPGTLFADGPSFDQVAAQAINPGGKPALTTMVGYRANNQLGYISFSGPDSPVTGENNPWLIYQDLMGLGDISEEAKLRIAQRRQSVLDMVEDDFAALQSKLSKDDAMKVEMHLDSIRDLELGMIGSGLIECALDPARAAEVEALNPDTVATDAEFKRIGLMQLDILAMAIACGATHVGSIQWGSGAGGPIFTWDGMNHQYNHHKLSHGNTKDDNSGEEVAGYLEMLTAIDRWYAEQYRYLLDKLAGYQEGDGTVLDNSVVVWANELGDGKGHTFFDLPWVIAGSGGGYLKQGQYLKMWVNGETDFDTSPHNRLLITLLNAVGVTANGGPVTEFGHPNLPKGEYAELRA
jgi:hypothetical protein